MTNTNTSILELVIAAADDDPRVPDELNAVDDWETFGRRAFDLLVILQNSNRTEPVQDSSDRPTFWATIATLTLDDDRELTAHAISTLNPQDRDRLLFTSLAVIRILRTATPADAAATWQALIDDENKRTGNEPTE